MREIFAIIGGHRCCGLAFTASPYLCRRRISTKIRPIRFIVGLLARRLVRSLYAGDRAPFLQAYSRAIRRRIVENMTGAGGIIAANHLITIAQNPMG